MTLSSTCAAPARLARTVMLCTALLLAAPAAVGAGVSADARTDADWILQSQLPDGAIANHVDRRMVWPYLGNFAALGLVRASQVTSDPRYVDAAWRWLAWYQAHQDASGFVTDYAVIDGQPVSSGEMDSTDAYAGTFLLAACAAWRATGDLVRLQAIAPGIHAAVGAIRATQASDGLTWVKPGVRVKYLMDQAEAYAGLRVAATLAGALGDSALEQRAGAAAKRLRAGVSRLWDDRRQAYDWAVHGDGRRQHTNWRVLYPDALQQAWAVAFGLAGPNRSAKLMHRFAIKQPRWDRPAGTARYRAGRRATGYWAPAGWAFARVGDLRRSEGAARRLRAAALARSRAWPFTPSDAGQLIVLTGLSEDVLVPLLGAN